MDQRSSRRPYRGLIGLNVALLVLLAAVSFTPGADAQAQDERPRGAYAMVAGVYQGSSSEAIYVVDRANQELIAMTFEPGRKRLVGIDYARLDRSAGGSR